MRPAFTLVEMMAVVAMILVMTSLAGPAAHRLILQSQTNSAVHTFSGLVAGAQATAQSHFTTAAVRIERAFKTDEHGQMLKDHAGNALRLPRQQARILVFGMRQPDRPIGHEERAFRQLAHSGVTRLPREAWLAPDYALSLTFVAEELWRAPSAGVAPISTLDTFHVAFDRRGELVQVPAKQLIYLDETQGDLFAGHPYPSARGAVVYRRATFEDSGGDAAYLVNGRPLYINRFTGCVVEGAR